MFFYEDNNGNFNLWIGRPKHPEYPNGRYEVWGIVKLIFCVAVASGLIYVGSIL